MISFSPYFRKVGFDFCMRSAFIEPNYEIVKKPDISGMQFISRKFLVCFYMFRSSYSLYPLFVHSFNVCLYQFGKFA